MKAVRSYIGFLTKIVARRIALLISLSFFIATYQIMCQEVSNSEGINNGTIWQLLHVKESGFELEIDNDT